MNKKRAALKVFAVLFFGVVLTCGAGASEIGFFNQGDILSGAPDYDWWYGCSPTAAGMMMGYYDINGYDGQRYDNLVPGRTAELENFTDSGMLAKNIIASDGHIAAFYQDGDNNTTDGNFGEYNDDLTDSSGNFLRDSDDFNSLADFMGTSQDKYGLSNGATRFWVNTDGSRLDYWDVQEGIINNEEYAEAGVNSDGMYGIGEYVTYAGYGFDDLYTQLTSNNYFGYESFSGGFSFEEYMAEIYAGRVVMLHAAKIVGYNADGSPKYSGHSMFGYGYESINLYLHLHDTWTLGQKSMTWDGTYQSDWELWGVTVLALHVPEPATLILLFSGMMAFPIAVRRRKNCEKKFPI